MQCWQPCITPEKVHIFPPHFSKSNSCWEHFWKMERTYKMQCLVWQKLTQCRIPVGTENKRFDLWTKVPKPPCCVVYCLRPKKVHFYPAGLRLNLCPVKFYFPRWGTPITNYRFIQWQGNKGTVKCKCWIQMLQRKSHFHCNILHSPELALSLCVNQGLHL